MTLEELQKNYPEIELGKAENLVGQKFNKLTPLYRVAKDPRNVCWACKCDCGEYTVVRRNALKSGSIKSCGCLSKPGNPNRKSNKLIDLTGQTFGYWEVLKRGENTKDGQARWICKCTACGTIKEVPGQHLRSGISTNCGCIRMEKMRRASIKDETGKVYSYLKVERMATEEEKPRTDRTGVYWNCTCLRCGRKNVIVFGDYLRNGDTKSCGCINSINEFKISQMLDEMNIKYKTQWMFDDLTRAGRKADRLMFDFAILENNELKYIIEYDGSQHFDHKSFYGALDEATRPNDLLKNNYCFEHNIPLIRIPYDIDYNKEDLILETTRFLFKPELEEEYYLSREKNG